MSPVSSFQRDYRSKPEPDMIRAFRKDFLKGIPFLPALKIQDWKSQPDIFHRAYAEALIWHKLFGDDSAINDLPDEIAMFRPFGSDTPELRTLLRWRGAVALFPVCNDNSAQYYHQYLFVPDGEEQWSDHRKYLTDDTAVIDRNLLLYLTTDFSPIKQKIDGHSWHLAYWMAYQVLDRKSPDNQKKLIGYLITGEVENRKILPVQMEKKIELLDKYSEITLLAPESNRRDLSVINPERYDTAADIDQAWRIVSGSGFEKKEISLPDPVEELHILAGGTIQPLLTVILLLNPKKVCIWRSEDEGSRKTAHDAKDLLSKRCVQGKGLKIDLEIQRMDSHDLQQAYADFDQILKRISDKSNVIICNTGGNRLMGFAAMLAALTYGITVVYRDRNAEPGCLTGIKASKNLRQSSDIKVNYCPIQNEINWAWLYSSEKYHELKDLYDSVFLS